MNIFPQHQRQLAVLGEILFAVRQRNNLTTKQLAERLDKSESFIVGYESGGYRLDLPELVDIADALGIDMVELVNLYQQRI